VHLGRLVGVQSGDGERERVLDAGPVSAVGSYFADEIRQVGGAGEADGAATWAILLATHMCEERRAAAWTKEAEVSAKEAAA